MRPSRRFLGVLIFGLSAACSGEIGALDGAGGDAGAAGQPGGFGGEAGDGLPGVGGADNSGGVAGTSTDAGGAGGTSGSAGTPSAGGGGSPSAGGGGSPSAGGGGSPSAGGGGSPSTGPSSTRHTPHPVGTKYASQGFWEYLPPNYGTSPRPLLVALHGIGENGAGNATTLEKLGKTGIPKLINTDKWPDARPFVVLSPQHVGGGCPSAKEIHDFIAFGMATYDIDPKRVYLTGLSCGAIGGFNYIGSYLTQQLAAFVPVAGDGKGAWNKQGCNLGVVPIWAFHGDQDKTVNKSGSEVPLQGLLACTNPSPKDAKLTMYPGVGHDSWTRTYDLSAGHDPFAWLLTHQLP